MHFDCGTIPGRFASLNFSQDLRTYINGLGVVLSIERYRGTETLCVEDFNLSVG